MWYAWRRWYEIYIGNKKRTLKIVYKMHHQKWENLSYN
jgi:hypothetical protein